MENEEIIEIQDDTEPIPEPFVIPNIYMYSESTKEYTGLKQADRNPAESILRKKFIPLVPANATLLEVPEYGENEIPVYSITIIETEVIENWDVKPDYRQNFMKVDNSLNVTPITTIGEQEGYFVVDKETAEDIAQNPDWYKIGEDEIVKKTETEYEEEQAEKREADFNKAFFNTSLGYVRRSVTMADGSHKDFLSDLLPVISMGVQSGMPVNILTYDKPPFDHDIEDWTEYQHQVVVTAQFIQECFLQLSADFAPINNEGENES